MEIELLKTKDGLIPITDEGVRAVQRIKVGSPVYMTYKPRRNMKFHKKYFALLNQVKLNQEHYKTVDNIHEAVKFRGGYYETIFTLNGDKLIVTKSIAFHSMDNAEFEEFYSVAIDVCLELVGDDALNEIIRFL